jgi:hypothetical protein
MATFDGGCLCGRVRYRLSGPLSDVVSCHCRQCRRTSGHYAAMTSVPMARFELTHDDDGLAWYRSSDHARRGFCRHCGSNLFWKPDGEDRIAVAGGSVDGPLGVETALHIFCAEKGDYYDIDPDAEQKPTY